MNEALDTSVNALKSISFGSITLQHILQAIITLLVCLIAIKLLMRVIERAINRLPAERGLHGLLKKTCKFLLYLLTVLIVAGTLGIPVSSLIALFSILGLAASLAAQNSLSNLAGGLTVMITRPFILGDFIDCGGTSGTVTQIGLVYTKLKSVDGKTISLPNSDVAAAQITNYSSETLRRVDFTVGASYNNSIDEVKAALRAALATQAAVLAEPAPYINVAAYEESCIKYTLRVWVNNDDYWQVWAALLEEIKHAFDAHGVQMTYNHLNVHVLQESTERATS